MDFWIKPIFLKAFEGMNSVRFLDRFLICEPEWLLVEPQVCRHLQMGTPASWLTEQEPMYDCIQKKGKPSSAQSDNQMFIFYKEFIK